MAPASERSSVVSERVAASAHAPCPRLTPWVASTCRIGGKLRDSRRPRQMAFPVRQACSRRLSRPAVRRRVRLRGRRRPTMDHVTGLKAEAERRFGATRAEALKQAIEVARGVLRGPLHGVVFGAKDIFYSAGLRTEGGSKVMAGFVPSYDATSVARLKSAGAILLGKCHTTEFATYDPSPARNPWNLACTPGGSSSGSAAAVAAREVPIALGTQTIGSNVRPASYCGLVGLKPTLGRISTRGVMPLSYTQDHVGLMTRSVEDMALGLSVTAGHDPGDPSSSRSPVPDYVAGITRRRPPRIGLMREFFFERATPEVGRITSQADERLARASAHEEDATAHASLSVAQAAANLIVRCDTATVHADLFAQKADLYRPAIRSMIETGMLVTGESYVRALRIRRQFRRELAELLERYDVLLTPTTPAPARRR